MEALAGIPFSKLIWIIGVDYDTTRQEFLYLSEGAISSGLARPSEVHMSVSQYTPSRLRAINGCIVETRTLANVRKLASKAPDMIIVTEPGIIDYLPLVFELCMGRVSEKKGRIFLAGTSDEASEDWYELWREWQDPNNPIGGDSFSIPTWENTHSFPGGREDREFHVYEQKYGHEALMAHFGGIPSDPQNLVMKGYWKKDVHVSEEGTSFDRSYPAEITIDPNYSLEHRYSIEIMQWDPSLERDPCIWIADEIAEEGLTHDDMRALFEQNDCRKFITGGTIDPYAAESHVFGAPSPVSYWDPPFALRYHIRPRVNTTVQALKQALSRRPNGKPRMMVSPKATRFIWEMGHWKGNKSGRPDEQNCDATKAAGYWLVDQFSQEMAQGEEDNSVTKTSEWSYDGAVPETLLPKREPDPYIDVPLEDWMNG